MSAVKEQRWGHRMGAKAYRGMERWMGNRLLDRLDADCQRAHELNHETLLEILKKNRKTEWGVEAGFAEMLKAEDPVAAFRKAVPVSTYEDFVPSIERIAQGIPNVLCADPVESFAQSSGTTGRAKLVPVTKESQMSMVMQMACMVPTRAENQVVEHGGQPSSHLARDINLMSMTGSAGEHTEGGIKLSTGSAGGIQRMRKAIPYMWCSPADAFMVEDVRVSNYLHALFGLRDRQVRKVQGVFAPHVLEWLRCIEQWFPALLEDIERGQISTSVKLDPALRRSLQAELTPDPERARELEEAGRKGFGDCLARFWPGIGCVATCISGSFAQYREALEHYTGRVPIFNPMYGASEAMVGVGLWLDEPNRYALSLGSAFFEFIPSGNIDEAQPPTVLPEHLQVGHKYEVVLTNRAGLYRYRLGDVIRCVGTHHQAPVLQFEYRRGTQLDLVGEKTTEAQALDAVRSWSQDWLGCDVREYTTAADVGVSPPRYVFYVQLETSMERIAAQKLEHGARMLDASLFGANPRYDVYARRKRRVGPPRLVLVGPDAFSALQRKVFELNGNANHNQYKLPRVLKKPELVEVMEQQAVAVAEPLPTFLPSSPAPVHDHSSHPGRRPLTG